jgi:uncharacterized DUF497 family protein
MGPKFDPEKDAANIVKHGLSLVEGEGVLNDPLGLTVEDDYSAGESRWITVGMNAGGRNFGGCLDGVRRRRAPNLRATSNHEGAERL